MSALLRAVASLRKEAHHGVTTRFEHQLLAVETEHRVHCMLELTAPPAPTGRVRPPLHPALVLDRSGSMAGRKLEVVRECAAFLMRRLAPTDELAIVAYDQDVRLVAPLAHVDLASLLPRIAAIHSGGQTNLSGGWLKGLEEVGRASGEGPRKVLLLTDGLANVGVVDPAVLVSMARNAIEQSDVGTTTIGFGDDFDEDLLTAMADAGRGNAHYAPTPEAAPAIFAREFEDLVSLVAQNVSVEIRPTHEVQVLGVLNAFPVVPVPGGLQVDLGDAYAEETRRVVFELHVPSLASLGVRTVADVVLRHTAIGERDRPSRGDDPARREPRERRRGRGGDCGRRGHRGGRDPAVGPGAGAGPRARRSRRVRAGPQAPAEVSDPRVRVRT